MRYSISATGFWVGWSQLSLVNFCTLLGYLFVQSQSFAYFAIVHHITHILFDPVLSFQFQVILASICGLYCILSQKTDITSWHLPGCFFTRHIFEGLSFSHIQSYLYILILLILKALLKGSLPNNTIAPFGLIILFSCSHIKSNGITWSQRQAVDQYGGSVMIQSILPSGILFIHSRQSSLNIWFSILQQVNR